MASSASMLMNVMNLLVVTTAPMVPTMSVIKLMAITIALVLNYKNENSSLTCSCEREFSDDSVTCTDNNECAPGLHNCYDNASYINLYGSYECSCDNGFTGNRENCFDIDEREIENTCGNNGICKNINLTVVVVTMIMPESAVYVGT